MSFWRRLFRGRQEAAHLYPVRVRCARCGEIIETQINLHNDLTAEYEESGRVRGYFVRKVLQGSGATRCFASVEVTLRFDGRRQVIDREIRGGEFTD